MNKKLIKGVTLALSATLLASSAVGMAACGKSDPLASEAQTSITFWGYGDDNERGVFQSLVNQFNTLYAGQIYVKYEPQSSSNYGERLNSALNRGRATVDVLYVPDESIKSYATDGYLAPLDEYIATSTEIVPSEMWETSLNRYRYGVDSTTTDGPDAKYYGVPKDIGPTVIFYNEDHFTDAGVKVMSVAAEDLAAFNAGTKTDDRGQSKAALGITGEVKEKGYFELNGQKYFNNQVPMSWSECVALAQLVQEVQRTKHNIPAGQTGNYYGYFTEWWFNYGWSVGGDCIEYVADPDDATLNGGYWEFTLMDDTPNFIVADNAADFTINGNTYKAGEIISWQDKLVDVKATNKQIASEVTAAKESGQLNQLPSQRDAFVEFVRVGQFASKEVDNGLMGYGICPSPSSMGSDADKSKNFKNGYISMLVDGRWNVVDFRDSLCETLGNPKQGGFNWDVAPLPIYKEYDADGNITVHGVEAGHSGSVALSINAKSTKKDAAWKFLEYIGGSTGQIAQARSGFAIPSQKDLCWTEDFLQSTKCPLNSKVFIKAAEVEKAGDWWYLKDKLWINPWADVLNGPVRNGTMTLTQFQNSSQFTGTNARLRTYTAK